LKERKLDIFDVLRATDRRDGNWLNQQSDDARKEFTPLVVMRWAATVVDGPESAYMLYMVNERVNCDLYVFYRHPDLVFRLLASCGLGKVKKHQWLAGPTRKPQSNPAFNLLHEQYPEASDGEINLLLSLFDRVSFKQFVDECGVQPDDAKGVMISYDRLKPEEAPQSKTKAKGKT
jgi:hypothetical protein